MFGQMRVVHFTVYERDRGDLGDQKITSNWFGLPIPIEHSQRENKEETER